MLKDYIIKDNAFKENLDEIIKALNEVPYYFSEDFRGRFVGSRIVEGDDRPPGGWIGFRSKHLIELDRDLYNKVCHEIMENIINTPNQVECEIHCFFHILPTVKNLIQSWIHKDDDGVVAGVIYLSENPKPDSGTQISFDDGMKITVQNKFNRLVAYRSEMYHCVESGFGETLDDSRKTLVFFIKYIRYDSLKQLEQNEQTTD
jgi:hypothetical protein